MTLRRHRAGEPVAWLWIPCGVTANRLIGMLRATSKSR